MSALARKLAARNVHYIIPPDVGNSRLLFERGGNIVFKNIGGLSVFLRAKWMYVHYSYPDLTLIKVETWSDTAWMATVRPLDDTPEYVQFMNAVIDDALEMTQRFEEFDFELFECCGRFGDPKIEISDRGDFQLQFVQPDKFDFETAAQADHAKRHAWLFPTWQEKLDLIGALPQPIAEEILPHAVFFTGPSDLDYIIDKLRACGRVEVGTPYKKYDEDVTPMWIEYNNMRIRLTYLGGGIIKCCARQYYFGDFATAAEFLARAL